MPDQHRPCGDPRCPICATTRIPAMRIDPPTTPVPAIRPEWLPGDWKPAAAPNGHDHGFHDPARTGWQLRVAAASCSAMVLVGAGGLSATADLRWLLAIMPGGVVVAAVVVGVVELVRRHR